MENIITSIASTFNTSVNDSVFCTLLDTGIDPGTSWDAVYGNDSLDISSFVLPVTDTDDFQDVEFALI